MLELPHILSCSVLIFMVKILMFCRHDYMLFRLIIIQV